MFKNLIRRFVIDDDPDPNALSRADLWDRGITELAGAKYDGFSTEVTS